MGILDDERRGRGALLTGIGLLALTVSACAPGGADASSSPHASPSPTRSASPDADPERERLEAKVVANAAPTDLRWGYSDPPSSWSRMPTETGTEQWQPASPSCVVTLSQPAGLGTAEKPTSSDIVDQTVSGLATTLHQEADPTVIGQRTLTLPARVDGLDVEETVLVPARRIRLGPTVEAVVYGYRDGDFALVFTVVCGSGHYEKVTGSSGFQKFVSGLTVLTTY